MIEGDTILPAEENTLAEELEKSDLLTDIELDWKDDMKMPKENKKVDF